MRPWGRRHHAAIWATVVTVALWSAIGTPQTRANVGAFQSTAYLTLPESLYVCAGSECQWSEPIVKTASLYPSSIAVSGLAGTVRKVTVTLHGLTTRRERFLQLLLVGPAGQSVTLMQGLLAYTYGSGSSIDEVTNQSPTFDDVGRTIPCKETYFEPITTSSYQPFSCYETWPFQPPAPAKPSGAALAVFNGSSPNGTWNLYAQHESGKYDGVTIADGWSLRIETEPPSLPDGGSTPGGSQGGESPGAGSTGSGSGVGSQTVGVGATQVKRSLAAQLTPSGKAAKIATLLKTGVFTRSFKALEAGTVAINWYYLSPGAKLATEAKPKPVLVASGTLRFLSAGARAIKLKLTTAGKGLLKHATRLRLTAKGTFIPTGETSIVATKTLVLNR